MSDEVLNIGIDGWQRSPYFDVLPPVVVPDFSHEPEFVLPNDAIIARRHASAMAVRQDNNDDVLVWVADMRRIVVDAPYTIARQLVHLLNNTIRAKQAYNTIPHKIVLFDFRDRIHEKTLCTSGVQLLQRMMKGHHGGGGNNNVVSVRQQVVRDRHWDATRHIVVPGTVWDSSHDAACFGGQPPIVMPYTVRSDLVEALDKLERRSDNNDRPVDVSHFWSPRSAEQQANWRNAVSDSIARLNDTVVVASSSSRRRLRVVAAHVSEAKRVGRIRVATAYAEALRASKIVVVAQRDGWEDHYRLFEAMISGALVLSDAMLHPPPGLVEGVHWRIYHDLTELEHWVRYYVQHETERQIIARQGRSFSLAHHRNTHWMERVFFGNQLSQ